MSLSPAPLSAAQLYLCTDSRQECGDFADFVDAAFRGGVDIIQLRDKQIEAAEELELLAVVRESAERHGTLWAVNDRADIASLSDAPVFHVGQKDLSIAHARQLLGPNVAIGLSCHTPAHVDVAVTADGLDYFCTGPVWATPTKPGRPAVGTQLVTYAAERVAKTGSALPWFAIGGIDLSTIDEVVDAGASRVVVVRAITEATDPADAAAALRRRLPPLTSSVVSDR